MICLPKTQNREFFFITGPILTAIIFLFMICWTASTAEAAGEVKHEEQVLSNPFAYNEIYVIEHHATYEKTGEGVLVSSTPIEGGRVEIWSTIPALVELPDGTVFRTPGPGEKRIDRNTITIIHLCEKKAEVDKKNE